MAIHELVPEHEIGLIKWGKKLGREIRAGESITVEPMHTVFSDSESESGMGVAVGFDSVKPVYGHYDLNYGFVQISGNELVGKQINEDSVIGKKIRWVEEI